MAREHGVLAQLWRAFPLAPRALALCADPGVIGAPFFVMERRHGLVVRTAVPPELDALPDGRRRASLALVDGLADLHAVDPAALGLDELGRPAGFLDRQLAGWRSRWERAADRERPVFARIHAQLAATRPRSPEPALVHNDWKLDNAMLDPADPGRLHAVLDWDMTTQGDPLVDLGTLLAYWSEPGDRGARRGVTPVTAQPGFPTRAELAARYAERRGTSLEAIRWYEAFGLWRLAVILQQIYIRFARRQTADPRFARFGDTAAGLLDSAAALVGVPIG
jgi:aminoglycoside phosphotransferase (APT) family kinase protein